MMASSERSATRATCGVKHDVAAPVEGLDHLLRRELNWGLRPGLKAGLTLRRREDLPGD